MRVSAALLTALAGFAVLTLLSPRAFAGPIIVEETARLSSPNPDLPLNGPVALYGNTMAVGSILAAPDNYFLCTVFLYERPTPTGAWSYSRTLTQFLLPSDGSESFLAIDAAADAIAVSADRRASVFERTATGWAEKPLVRQPGADIASDIAISGDLAVVGGADSNTSGYVYHKAADEQWPFETQLRAGPLAIYDADYIGEKVDINGNILAIVSPDVDDDFPHNLQRLYVFRRTDAGQWLQVAMLQDPEAPESPKSGAAVSAVTLTGGLGLAAFRNQANGVSLFYEQSRDAWAPLDNVRPVDALMNRTVMGRVSYLDPYAPIELNRQPAPAAAIAVGVPDDDDRAPSAGSVDVFAPESGLSSWRHVAEFVASDAQSDHRLGKFMAFHNNTVAAVGGNRVYVFTMPTSFTQPALVQDDFEDGDAAGWRQTSSNWTVTSSRGSRVYRQGSTSGEHVATLPGIDWRDVAIEADVRPTAFNGSDRWVSLMTRHVDDQNYYYVALRNTNVLRLAKRVGNTFTTLASSSLPVAVNRSYRVRLEAVGTWLRVYVDGQLRLQARDTTFRHGGVGLKTAYAQAEFDNVLVRPNPLTTLLADDFEATSPFPWVMEPAANWSEVDIGSNIVLRQTSTAGTSRATIGVEYGSAQPELANQVVAARVRALSFGSTDARFGLMARFRDNSNYTSVVLNSNGTIALRKNTNGSVAVLDSASLAVSTGTWYSLRLETVGDRLRVYVNDSLMLEARDTSTDSSSTRARYGLLTVSTAAEYDDVRVTEP